MTLRIRWRIFDSIGQFCPEPKRLIVHEDKMRKLFTALALFSMIGLVGCDAEKKEEKNDKSNVAKKNEGGGHDHGHGPNGEVTFSIKELDLHAEIIVDKTTKQVTIAFCDHDGKKEVPVKLDKARIFYGDESYELTAVDPKDGAASKYRSEESDDLLILTKNRPDFEVTMGDKSGKTRLPRPH